MNKLTKKQEAFAQAVLIEDNKKARHTERSMIVAG
jgi:hypothetical protein